MNTPHLSYDQSEGKLRRSVSSFDNRQSQKNLDLEILERALKASPHGIIITEASAQKSPLIIYVNHAFEQITGYSQDEVFGKTCRFLQGPDTDPVSLKKIREAINNEQECRVIIKNYKKSGQAFWNELTISPVKSADRKITHFIGIQQDVTNKYLAEEEKNIIHKRLIDSNRSLEQTLSELKTAHERLHVTQAQLVQAQKLEAIGKLAAGIAHEINTPLSTILMNAEYINEDLKKSQIDPTTLLTMNDCILRTASRISHIIKGLKVFTRDTVHEPIEATNLGSVCRDALELCRERFLIENIGVTLSVPDKEPVVVECRATQIFQVLVNLLNNAYAAVLGSEERWIKIEIFPEKNKVSLQVTNSGPGIPLEIREQITHFFTTQDPSFSSGLGLSLTRDILRNHGGTIKIDTDCQHTRFVIQLPKKQKNILKQGRI